MALVVLKPGTAGDPAAYAREPLAGYKVLKSIDLVETLPQNPWGRSLRRELRENYHLGYQRRVN